MFGRVRCVSIAVPTRLHFQVARDFIEAGIDVLVEKPLTANIAEARELGAIGAGKRRHPSGRSSGALQSGDSPFGKSHLVSPSLSSAIGWRRSLSAALMSTWSWT